MKSSTAKETASFLCSTTKSDSVTDITNMYLLYFERKQFQNKHSIPFPPRGGWLNMDALY